MGTFKFANKEIEARYFLNAIKVYEEYINENIQDFIKVLKTRIPIAYMSGNKQMITEEYIHNIAEEYITLLFKLFPQEMNLESISKKYKIAEIKDLRYYDYTRSFNWGKHKNLEVCSVVSRDPSYIIWCVLNLDKFVIDPFVFLLNNVKVTFPYMDAVALNYIKWHRFLLQENEPENEDHSYRYTDRDTFRDAFDCDVDSWRQFND